MTEATTPRLGEDKTTTNGSDTAAPSGAAVRGSKLPRLGSAQAKRQERKTVDLDIPEAGVSVLLRAPGIRTIVDLQDRLEAEEKADDGEVTGRGLDRIVAMAALMLVEPEWDEPQLRKVTDEWSPSDFAVFSHAVLVLAGIEDEEVLPAVQADFLEPKD